MQLANVWKIYKCPEAQVHGESCGLAIKVDEIHRSIVVVITDSDEAIVGDLNCGNDCCLRSIEFSVQRWRLMVVANPHWYPQNFNEDVISKTHLNHNSRGSHAFTKTAFKMTQNSFGFDLTNRLFEQNVRAIDNSISCKTIFLSFFLSLSPLVAAPHRRAWVYTLSQSDTESW